MEIPPTRNADVGMTDGAPCPLLGARRSRRLELTLVLEVDAGNGELTAGAEIVDFTANLP
jgi:hypothetical protein